MASKFKFSTGGIGRTLRHRNYRVYWIYFFVATTSRWVQRTGVAWLTWELTHSPTWLGIVAFAEMFPLVIFSVWGGAIADRIGSLRMVRLTLTMTALGTAVFAGLVLTDLIDIWTVVILIGAIASIWSFGNAAQMSLINNLVPKSELSAAFALGSATFNASRFIGPGIAGVTIALLGIGVTIAVGAVGLAAWATALYTIHLQPESKTQAKKQSTIADIIDGVRYTAQHVGIRNAMILLGVTAILVRPYMELLPGFSDEVFGRGAEGLALLMSATGFGGLIGGVWLAIRGRNEGLAEIIVVSLLISGIALLVFTVTDQIWIAAIAAVFLGVSMLSGNIASQTLIQSSVDPAIRARVIAIFILMAWGIPALGAILMGWIASVAGLQPTLGVGAVLTILTWLWAKRQVASMAALEDMIDAERDVVP
ncbi:MAG: MFS transporter [Pseudomonadota bacterium]|nr:MFS transporter [Pseudomonadota bacterium]